MEVITLITDNVLAVFSAITTIILFVVYYRLNKRQKKAEVEQAEAGVKQSEGGALTTMQGAYDEFTKDYMEKWEEVKVELSSLKQSDREKSVIIDDLQRQSRGLSREVGQLKLSLTDVEKIACVKFDCKIRQPELGTYKHKIAE